MTLIKEALYAFAAEENAQIERAIESGPKPPESLYLSCREIAEKIATEKKKALPFKKTIAVLIAATLIISLFAVVAYAARDKIGGFFVDFFEKYAELSTDTPEKANISPSNVLIEYIPDGFTEVSKKIGNTVGAFDWKSMDGYISLHFKLVSNGSHAIDNENTDFTAVGIGDLTVFRTEKYGQINATWTDEKMVYTLSATGVTWDEIVKIIEGIKVEE